MNCFDNYKNMSEALDATDFLVQNESFVQFRRTGLEGGDPVLFATLNGLLEQTIRCRSLDVASTFRESFFAKVRQLKARTPEVQGEYTRIMDLFDQALEGRLTLDQARVALLDVQSTDIMQTLFIQNNPTKVWLIERLNDGIPVDKNDENVIPWFCKTFGIKICIYWLESHSEYERVEFFSPRVGMIVNIYQRQNEFETETGLLYFAGYDEKALEPTYPNCCLASDLLRKESKFSADQSSIPKTSIPSISSPQILPEQVKHPPEQYKPLSKPPDISRVRSEPTIPLTKSNAAKIEGYLAEIQQILSKSSQQAILDQIESRISSSMQDSEPQGIRSNPSSIGIGSNPPSQSQGLHTTDSQPSKSQTIKPRLVQVKAEETKTSDPVVTRSLPPARKKIVPKTICSACKTGIIGLSYECSPKCKVCVPCLVRSELPAKTCPGCSQITLTEEAVDSLKKLRPN
jgi:hypothetical protein